MFIDYRNRASHHSNHVHVHWRSPHWLEISCAIFTFGALLKEYRQCRRHGISRYVRNFWNWLEFVSSLLALVGLALRSGSLLPARPDDARVVLAFCVILMWARLLEIFKMSQLGPIIVVMIQMGYIVLQFFCIITLLTVGWAIALHSLLESEVVSNIDGADAFRFRDESWPQEYHGRHCSPLMT